MPPNLPNFKEDPDRTTQPVQPEPVQPYSIWDAARDRMHQEVEMQRTWLRKQYHDNAVRQEEQGRRDWQNKMAGIELKHMGPTNINNAFQNTFGTPLDTMQSKVKYYNERDAREADSVWNRPLSKEEEMFLNVLKMGLF